MTEDNIPPQLRIWQLGLGFANTSVMSTLVRLGVMEELGQKPKTLSELADACKLNEDILYRVLRFASVINLVTQNDGKYTLTDTGRYTLRDVPGSLYMGMILIGSEPWLRAWEKLDHSLTTGEVAFDKAMGDNFFNFIGEHPEYSKPYNDWMSILSSLAAGAIIEAYDFNGFKTVCDVGGGHGLLLKRILETNPHLNGILYDQKKVLDDHLLSGMEDRVSIVDGDFFESVPKADVLMMKNILHDWPDEKCLTILKNCKDVMEPSSRLLIMEMVIGPKADIMGTFYDLHMQVLIGGKERTEDEYGSLIAEAGLKLNRVISTKSPLKIIEVVL